MVLPDDSFFVYRGFNRWNGENVGPLIKFKPDGTRDASFKMAVPCLSMSALAIASNGQLIVGIDEKGKRGGFSRVLRVNADGSVDSSFVSGTGDLSISGIAVQPDGKILVAGTFTEYAGQKRPGVVRLHPDGSVDQGFASLSFANDGLFNPSFNLGAWSEIVVQPDGKILFAGAFTSVNGVAR